MNHHSRVRLAAEKGAVGWRIPRVVFYALAFTTLVSAQSSPFGDDLRALTKAGSVKGNVYSNPYAGFKVVLPQPPCDPELNTSVDPLKGKAILLNCTHVVKGWGGMYTFSIAVDYAANYPTLSSVEQYVRSLRHSAERDPNQKTVQAEQSRRMAGVEFVQAVLSNHLPSGTYYQGIACTRLKGYLLCFETEAPSIDAARALLNLDDKLQLAPKQPPR